MLDVQQKKEIQGMIQEEIKNQDTDSSFRKRRTIDTPTDAYSITNRRFVTLSSNVGARPLSSVAVTGQHFFNTTTSTPMVFDGNNWRNGIGSIVAAGRNS